MSKHLFIPDTQVKPGVPTEHLEWAGHYIVDKQPDVVVMAGDFADMPSLSSYDAKGSKKFEGRRYDLDIKAARAGMKKLLEPLRDYQLWTKGSHKPRYEPRLVLTLGNHEDRITRAINNDPHTLEGMIMLTDLGYEEVGWEVYPYLQPVVIDGVAYCHYFTSGVMGRPVTAAKALLTKKHMSCMAGHQQGWDIANDKRADGVYMTAIIAGSFYQHDEDYLDAQSNKHWRGVIMLHEVNEGAFQPMLVSLDYLKRKYG